MINNVVLVGRITKDPEIRYTSSNIASCSFTLAVDRGFTSQSGERQSDFINCVAWRQSADFMSQYIKKGYMMGITGRIQTRSYQAQDGTTRYVTEVICDSVQNLQPRDAAVAQSSQPQSAQPAKSQKQPAEFDVTDVSEDDLPF